MSRPTLRMSPTKAKGGFTLIEMMAVMLIVAMVASLAIASTPGSGRAGLKAVTMQAAALLRREREGAILTGGDRRVTLDGARRVLIGESGDEVAIPRDVIVDMLGADAGSVPTVFFHADGASSGAALRFSREMAEYEIRVNWYSGGISVKAP
jgi:general secretion pathway protein H